MRANNPIVVTIPAKLKPYLTYAEATKTFSWKNDPEAKDIATAAATDRTVSIALYNERNDAGTYEQRIDINVTPKFATALNATVDFIVGNRSEWTLP